MSKYDIDLIKADIENDIEILEGFIINTAN